MIYIAGPLFTAAERAFNDRLAQGINNVSGEDVFLPQHACADCSGAEEIFRKCIRGIDGSRLVVAVLDGPDSDSGTSFEMGYAFAVKVPVIGIRTDFRSSGEDRGLNLMLTRSCEKIISLSCLDHKDVITEIIRELSPSLVK